MPSDDGGRERDGGMRLPDPGDTTMSTGATPPSNGVPDAGFPTHPPVPAGELPTAARASDPPTAPACSCSASLDEGAHWREIAPAGTATSDAQLGAVSANPDGAQIFWTSPSGAIRSTYHHPPFVTGWAPPFEVAPAGAAPSGARLTAVSTVAGGTTLVWAGGDGTVRSMFSDPSSNAGAWSSWFSLSDPGSAQAGAPIVAVPTADGSLSLYWVSPQGAIRSTRFDRRTPERGWLSEELAPAGSSRGPALGAASSVDRGTQLFWVDRGGAIISRYFDPPVDPTSWSPVFALSVAGEVSEDAEIAALSPLPRGTSVFWRNRAGSVRALVFDPRLASPNWDGPKDLVPPGSSAAGTRVLAGAAKGGGARVFFSGADGALRAACAESCAEPVPIGTAAEIAGARVSLTTIRGSEGLMMLFHVARDGSIRATDIAP